MAHQNSDIPTGSVYQPYVSVGAAQDWTLHTTGKSMASAAVTTMHPKQPRLFHQLWSNAQVLLTAIIPLTALITWLGYVRANPRIFDTFAGEKIGGRLSQAEAKAIDVISGAIIAPLFLAALNHIWFSSARVSALNEQQQKSIPLRTLVAASSNSSGNYDLFLLRDLLQGKTWRLFLLALLTLFSAISRSALSNVIAYESFSEVIPSDPIDLRLQRDTTIDKSFQGPQGALIPSISYRQLALYDFTASQNTQTAKEMMALLTDLSFENAVTKLTDGTYVTVNATSASLNSLPQNVVEIDDVPAYQLSVNCTPDLPNSIMVMPQSTNTQISILLNTTATSNNTLFQANFPGVPGNLQTGDSDGFSYSAFSQGSLEVYLGTLQRFNFTNDTSPSVYGNVGSQAFNMSSSSFTGTQGVMSVSGIRCMLYREYGLLNLRRTTGQNNNTSPVWEPSSSEFIGDEKKVNIPSMLSHFQWNNLNFHAPGSVMPGIGPALLHRPDPQSSVDLTAPAKDSFTDFSLNFLYASGEAQRILYEVAASSNNVSHHPAEFFTKVRVLETQQRYRITYVPSILMLGLLALLVASVVTVAMAINARNSISARTHREVNAVRLLLDGVSGLRDSKEDMSMMAQRSNGELESWAAGYKVRYTTLDHGDGTAQIVLEKHDR
jgi:hypothetical protein